MMTDFLKLKKPDVCKDSIAFENLDPTGQNQFGCHFYNLTDGFTPLKIRYNERTGILTIEGSIPFFWQGHNIGFQNSQLLKALEYCSEVLCINLMDFEVDSFEFGRMLSVETNPGYILKNHLALPKHSFHPHFTKSGELTGIEFSDPVRKVKMYNPKFSPAFKKISLEIKTGIPDFDPKGKYVRVENHVKRADIYLQIRNLSLDQYCKDEFQTMLKSDLIETYNSIQRKETFVLPDGIEKPSVNQLLYLILLEQNPNIKKEIEAKMKAMNLDPVTYKNRQSKIRNDLKQFEPIPDERTNLMPLLQESFTDNSETTVSKCQTRTT
jgi:hypothetical protein